MALPLLRAAVNLGQFLFPSFCILKTKCGASRGRHMVCEEIRYSATGSRGWGKIRFLYISFQNKGGVLGGALFVRKYGIVLGMKLNQEEGEIQCLAFQAGQVHGAGGRGQGMLRALYRPSGQDWGAPGTVQTPQAELTGHRVLYRPLRPRLGGHQELYRPPQTLGSFRVPVQWGWFP